MGNVHRQTFPNMNIFYPAFGRREDILRMGFHGKRKRRAVPRGDMGWLGGFSWSPHSRNLQNKKGHNITTR